MGIIYHFEAVIIGLKLLKQQYVIFSLSYMPTHLHQSSVTRILKASAVFYNLLPFHANICLTCNSH